MADFKRRELVLPTAANMLNVVNENIVNNLRRRRDSDAQLPSLYRLAFAVVYNTGEFLVTRGDTEEE